MNKKDRIAVVLSIPVLVLCSLGAMADGILFTPGLVCNSLLKLPIYQGDISFLGSRIQKDD